MKRSILGFVMLLILLAGGIFTSRYMQRCHRDMGKQLQSAAHYAQAGRWPQAKAALHGAETDWKQQWGITAALSDHAPMEQVNDLLARLKVYARAEDPVQFAAVCARLEEALDAISEAHRVTWWNLA